MRKVLVLALLLSLALSTVALAQDDARQLRIAFSWPTHDRSGSR